MAIEQPDAGSHMDASEEGNSDRLYLGIDGTMADAQDADHPFIASVLGPTVGCADWPRAIGGTAEMVMKPLARSGRCEQVRAYLAPEENAALTDDDITDGIRLVSGFSWSPLGTAKVIRSAMRRGWPRR